MATIPFTRDYAISELMPSGGGPLAAGDTLSLQGYNLIVDTDAVDYPVTITNSGGDANLELRDLGRIKLNATLPANVHPYVDPEHPLPVSAGPGIDGDPFRTNLTANARAEIQLNGAFGLGGGTASLPTGTRTGNFYAKVSSTAGSNGIAFDRDIPLHSGDMMLSLYSEITEKLIVESYDQSTFTATFTTAPSRRTTGDLWGLLAGGVCIRYMGGNRGWSASVIDAPIQGGTVAVYGELSFNDMGQIFSANVVCDRFMGSVTRNVYYGWGGAIGAGASCRIGQFASPRMVWEVGRGNNSYEAAKIGAINIADCACAEFCSISYGGIYRSFLCGPVRIGGGIISNFAAVQTFGTIFCGCEIRALPSFPNAYSALRSIDAKIGQDEVADTQFSAAGTITKAADAQLVSVFYHAPATSSDVTWRYTDRTVPPSATLRLRCAWLREGSTATRASVAVTDPATWWPQLWPLGAEALASVEFTGDTADWWRSELLTWRNTGMEAVQVRVWECVTGTVAGGYLTVEEVKGGHL